MAEFLQKRLISEFFGFQWQNLAEILSLFFGAILGHFWPILGHLGPFRVTFWPSWVILDLDVALGHSRRVFFFFFVANIAFTRFFCRKCRDYVLFGVEFWQKFWQKFLEILRILAEILRKKLACGASA